MNAHAHHYAHPTYRRRLSRAQVEHLAQTEMPELTRHLGSTASAMAIIHYVNSVDPQYDLVGLHAVIDNVLDPLIRLHASHRAVAVLAEFDNDHPTIGVPLLTKAALIGLLSDAANDGHHDPVRRV